MVALDDARSRLRRRLRHRRGRRAEHAPRPSAAARTIADLSGSEWAVAPPMWPRPCSTGAHLRNAPA